MANRKIIYSLGFLKRAEKLSLEIIKLAKEKEELFEKSPFHPSLRLHPLKGGLKGYWSLSVNKQYRIIFKHKESGDTIFLSIGKHDIYRHL
ncbi:MAG: type II toxin-antitoxin system mRNA interferase toxin, RelE/StbE family [Candidatus Pacebacteria bacterium]|nr:type II toxin-antitoxin system mRNA interferase toxin, RelE/StbE family [Candidatus Paceibacterota bacterium]